MRILLIAVVSCFLISAISTKKTNIGTEAKVETDISNNNIVNIDYLTDPRGWKLARITSDKPCDMNNDGVKHTEILREMSPCFLDDTLFIEKTNKAYYKRGKLCGGEPKSSWYDWELIDSKFIFSQGQHRDEMEILSVDDKKMVMFMTMESLGKNYHFTIIFTH